MVMLVLRYFFYTGFFLLPLFSAAQSGTLRVILSEVEFAANKTSINTAGRQELDEVAALLKATPAITAEIGAHTDASGSASYNLKLSRNRATAVRTYLVGKGITAKRLTARGFGETKPLNRCGRGVRCSDAEKRKNRRVELLLRNMPTDSLTRAPWMALGGLAPKKPVVQPDVPKVKPTVLTGTPAQPGAASSSAASAKPTAGRSTAQGDYFPELSEAKASRIRVEAPKPDDKQYVPQPLPRSFTGYTIELSCAGKPLAAGAELLRVHNPIYLRQDADMQYCYFAGAFFTLPEAQQFFQKNIAPKLPNARIVAFSNGVKKYLND